jgi:hypothetical protein
VAIHGCNQGDPEGRGISLELRHGGKVFVEVPALHNTHLLQISIKKEDASFLLHMLYLHHKSG